MDQREEEFEVFICTSCRRQFTKSYSIPDPENGIIKCPLCGANNDFDDLLDAYDEEDDELFWYLAPVIKCRCGLVSELPYSNLTQTDLDGQRLLTGGDPPELPPAEWSAVFGCRRCGSVATYGGSDVKALPIHKEIEGSYQSGAGVYRAEFPCGDIRCKAPASVHVNIGDGNEADLKKLLRKGHFVYRLPCGHSMVPVPEKYYELYLVTRRMW